MSSSPIGPPFVIETKGGPITIHYDQFVAVVRNAEYQADLTAATLREMGFALDGLRMPRNFLLELAAVVQLRVWENRGLTPYLKPGLPSAQAASQELAERAAKGVTEFQGEDAVPLSLEVFKVWIEQFAWQGQELLQADVVVGDVGEDEFVGILAEFFWTYRHQLENGMS